MDELTAADDFDGDDFSMQDEYRYSETDFDADTLASIGWGTDEDYGATFDSPTDFDEYVMNESDCSDDF